MHINVECFEITVNEDEMLYLASALRDKLLNSSEHCIRYNGMDTFWSNYKEETEMLKQMCTRLDKQWIYDDMLKDLEKSIKEKSSG